MAFVNRQTMESPVEGTEVDFHLLSEDTRYPPFHHVWFEDKLSFLRSFLNTSMGGNMTQGQAVFSGRSSDTSGFSGNIPSLWERLLRRIRVCGCGLCERFQP